MAQLTENKLDKRFDQNIEITGTLTVGEVVVSPSSYLTSIPSEYLTQTEGDDRYLRLIGGNITGELRVNVNDTGKILTSGNSSATGTPQQFFIQHNYGGVQIGNSRGNIDFTNGTILIGGNTAIHAGNYSSYITTSYVNGLNVNATTLDSIDSSGFVRDLGDVTVTNFDTLPDGWLGSNETTATNQPYANHHNTFTITNDASTGRKTQLFFADSPAGGFHYRVRQGDTTGWHPWEKIVTSNNISDYALTSYTETSTLDAVADRGRSTNQQLISTNPAGFRVDSGSYARIELDSTDNWSYVRLQDQGTTTWDIACYNSGDLEWRPGGGATNRMRLTTGGSLLVNEIWPQTSTNSARFSGAGDWGTRHYTSNGYIQFGPANNDWAHIYTDRPNFYFNKDLYVSGSKVFHYGNDGPGSGMNADLLDNLHSTDFVQQLSDTNNPNYQTPSSRRVDPNASNPTNEHYAISTFGNGGNVTGQLAVHLSNGSGYLRSHNNSWSAWRKIWTDANDGPGSGLNADLLDGIGGDGYLRSNATDTVSGVVTFSTAPRITARNTDSAGSATYFGSGTRLYEYMTNVGLELHSGNDEPITIYFKSSVNAPTDCAYITYDPDYNNTGENGALVLGSENDGGGSSDYIRLQARTVVDSNAHSSDNTEIMEWLYQGSQYAVLNTDYFQHNSDVRSPIFYDSSNTGYYCDPASTSVLNGLSVYNTVSLGNSSGDNISFQGHVKANNSYVATQDKIRQVDGENYFNINDDTTVDELIEQLGNVTGGSASYLSKVDDNTAPATGCFQLNGPVYFDSGGDYIKVDPNSDYTWELWVKYVSGSDSDGRIYLGTSMFNSSKSYFGNTQRYWGCSGTQFDSNSNNNGWYKITGTLSGIGSGYGNFISGTEYVKTVLLLNYNGGSNIIRVCGFRFYKSEKRLTELVMPRKDYIAVVGTSSEAGHYAGKMSLFNNGSDVLRIQNGNGYTQIGPGNTSYSHFATDRGSYYFDKSIHIDSAIYDYDNTGYYLDPASQSNLVNLVVGSTVLGDGKMAVRGGDLLLDRGKELRWTNNTGSGEYIYSKTSAPYDVTIHSGGYDALQCPNTGEVRINYNGAQKFVTTSGGVSITGSMTASGDVIAYSDERVKENIETIPDALDKVKNLRGVSYNRTDLDDKSKKIGVIAQEIQEVLPEVVLEQEDGMLGVSYGNITAVLIEAVKELTNKVEELENKLNGTK